MISFACAIGLHLATAHFQNEGRQNFNPGVWAQCDGFTAGAYHNSRDKTTAYLGYTFKAGPVDVTVAEAVGYGKPATILVPSVAIGSVRVAVFPNYRHRSGGVHFMWEF